MSVIVESDLELIMHLDFEHEDPCDVKVCDHAAEWKFCGSCCGVFSFMCDKHFQLVKKMEKMGNLNHATCGGDHVRIIFQERFKVSA